MALIKMTPQDLRDSANFLEARKTAIEGEVKSLKQKIDQVTSDWEGASKSSFLASFEQMLPMLTRDFPNVIVGIEKQLNGAADTIERADADIASAFNKG